MFSLALDQDKQCMERAVTLGYWEQVSVYGNWICFVHFINEKKGNRFFSASCCNRTSEQRWENREMQKVIVLFSSECFLKVNVRFTQPFFPFCNAIWWCCDAEVMIISPLQRIVKKLYGETWIKCGSCEMK